MAEFIHYREAGNDSEGVEVTPRGLARLVRKGALDCDTIECRVSGASAWTPLRKIMAIQQPLSCDHEANIIAAIDCPGCSKQLLLRDGAHIGAIGRCPRCRGTMLIPEVEVTTADSKSRLRPPPSPTTEHGTRSNRTTVAPARASQSRMVLVGTVATLAALVSAFLLLTAWGSGSAAHPAYEGADPILNIKLQGLQRLKQVAVSGRVEIGVDEKLGTNYLYLASASGPLLVHSDAGQLSWRVESGILTIVHCLVSVPQSKPHLSAISLVRDGVAPIKMVGAYQSGFEVAEATDLNEGLDQVHSKKKEYPLGFVFHCPFDDFDEKNVRLEIEWTSATGQKASGRYSLQSLPDIGKDK